MTGLGLAKNGTDMKRFVSPGFSPACGGALRNDSLSSLPVMPDSDPASGSLLSFSLFNSKCKC